MTFTICDMPQRSPEWYQARLGRLTGSCANDMLSANKSGGEAAGRRNLRVRLMLERITGVSQDNGFQSADMIHGVETEAEALAAYEARTGSLISRVGFLQHTTLMAGCSPDAHLDEFTGLVSVKCPKQATHLETLKTKTVPTEYLRQIQHELWITGAQWCDFLSFDPRWPAHLQVFLTRVTRNSLDMKAYEQAALAFLKEVDVEVEAVKGLAA